MATTPRARAGSSDRRPPVGRERMLRAAIELADATGLETLSMRRLAAELGIEAMSLYHYVAGRDELVAAMLDTVFAEMELPDHDGPWLPAIRRSALSAHHTLLRHPWSCPLLGSAGQPSPARLRWMDAILGRFRSGGFSAELTHHAYHALDSHIVGFTLWVLPYLRMARDQPDMPARFSGSDWLTGLPHLAEHVAFHLDDRPGDTSEFDFGLEILLDGLERLRRTEAAEGQPGG